MVTNKTLYRAKNTGICTSIGKHPDIGLTFGADGYRDNDDINNPLNIQSTAYSSDLAQQWNVFRSTEDEQKINYYNIGKVRWAGAFSQSKRFTQSVRRKSNLNSATRLGLR